ncbi:hypothetical protein [Thiorhodovibrio winogradskyi]|uniref:hypothetical protein n=1 Tax=Thiorhodovibrio winogradskyi TaxID=77007 RepID=UPI002E27C393|nr:hypothetical protein [Thiorhodovibrio winogradskyi]
MKHLIVSRCEFSDAELLEQYLRVSHDYFIPALKSQTNNNFEVALIVNNKHTDALRKKIDYPFIALDGYDGLVRLVKSEQIDIMTRHDIDDWMHDNYIDTIQHTYQKTKDQYGSDITVLIQAQPTKLLLKTGNEVSMKPYSDNNTSMFLSLCQHTSRVHIYQRNHRFMWQFAQVVVTLKEGLVKWVIHPQCQDTCRLPLLRFLRIFEGERSTSCLDIPKNAAPLSWPNCCHRRA